MQSQLVANFFRASPFTTEDGSKFYDLLDRWHYAPSRFGTSEPLGNMWGGKSLFTDLFSSQLKSYFGIIMCSRKVRPAYGIHTMFLYGPRAKHHGIAMYDVKLDDFEDDECAELLQFTDAMFETIKLDYGFICADDYFAASNTNANVSLSTGIIRAKHVVGMEWPDCIPGLYWCNYFSAEYFKQGLGANLSRVDRIVHLENGVRIMGHYGVGHWDTPEAQQSVVATKQILGNDWFFSRESGMPAQWLNTDKSRFAHPPQNA